MQKCNCENLKCDHWKKRDTFCANEGTIKMLYVGLVCADCAENHLDEFHVNPPLYYAVDARLNRKDKCIELFWLGKWRQVRYWHYKEMRPSQDIINEALRTFRMNVGKSDRHVRFRLMWKNDFVG